MTNPRYGWVVVVAGAVITCVALGALFSLAVFLQPMAVDTGWSRAGISAAMTLDFLALGVAGFAWGGLSDRYGARMLVLFRPVLLGAGLALAGRKGTGQHSSDDCQSRMRTAAVKTQI